MFEFIGPISSGVVVFGVAFLAGYLNRGQATATSVDIPRGEANNCQSLCDAWQALRRFRCNSARAEADAWVAIRALNASIASASTYAAVLLASAIAASLIPFIGAGIAAGLFAAYAAATTYVAFLLGQQAAAVQSANDLARQTNKARNDEQAAEIRLRQECKDSAQLVACLNSPAPC